jgi:hypothetical protein
MTSTASHPPLTRSCSPRPSAQPSRRKPRRSRVSARQAHATPTPTPSKTLDRYTDRRGQAREIVVRAGCAGSVLVLDRDAATLSDRRLIAHLAADEPAVNAAIVSRCYLTQARRERCLCRPLLAEDLSSVPFANAFEDKALAQCAHEHAVDRLGRRYELTRLQTGMSIPELRWCRALKNGLDAQPVSVRDAIAHLESYEPIRTLTRRALHLHDSAGEVSVTVLRAELSRVQDSPIVLNRGLREAMLAMTESQGLSMSEIAVRCGRIKRDRAGNESGETSWLARRLGLLAEGGRGTPTPWIHSDVLALIARDGLGLSPREVEVG